MKVIRVLHGEGEVAVSLLIERINAHHAEVKRVKFVREVRKFFSTVSVEVSAEEFSHVVHMVCDNPLLSNEDRKIILTLPLWEHPEFLTKHALFRYLTEVQTDAVLLTKIFDRFEKIEVSDNGQHFNDNSPELRITRLFLEALDVLSPGDIPAFAQLVLEKFGGNVPKNFRAYMDSLAKGASHHGHRYDREQAQLLLLATDSIEEADLSGELNHTDSVDGKEIDQYDVFSNPQFAKLKSLPNAFRNTRNSGAIRKYLLQQSKVTTTKPWPLKKERFSVRKKEKSSSSKKQSRQD